MPASVDTTYHHSTESFDTALESLKAWQDSEPVECNPEYSMRWMTHGEKTERAIILLHGFTNCPKQFYKLGRAFHQRSYNVLIPRFAGHAMGDRMSTALAELDEEKMISTVIRAINIGHGLGKHLTVLGLSMGGVLAAWAAEQREDVDLSVAISPALGYYIVPEWIAPLGFRLARWLPNTFLWWDSKTKDQETPESMMHAYPRYNLGSLAHIYLLGEKVLKQARHSAPRAGMVQVVINPADQSVRAATVNRLAENWRKAGATNLRVYTFAETLGLEHDLIDPGQPNQKVDIVYPVLLGLVDSA